MEALALVTVIAVCASLVWIALRIEPHLASKDGRKFLCMGQTMSTSGERIGRPRETRIVVQADGQLQVEQKRFMRRTTTFWRIEARDLDAPPRKAVFLLRGHDEHGLPIVLALRMPAGSRAVAIMDALVRSASAPSTTPSPS